MPLLDHFSILAPFYDRLLQYQSRDQLISLAKLPVEGKLLDAGGGTGRVAEALRGMVTQIVVADASIPMARQAAEKDGILAISAHAEALPFSDHCFERILMVDAFHHLADQEASAREIWRALKTGGVLVIEEPDIRTGIVKLVALAEKMALMRSHFLSPEQIVRLFPKSEGRVQLVREGYNAWIVIEKTSRPVQDYSYA